MLSTAIEQGPGGPARDRGKRDPEHSKPPFQALVCVLLRVICQPLQLLDLSPTLTGRAAVNAAPNVLSGRTRNSLCPTAITQLALDSNTFSCSHQEPP